MPFKHWFSRRRVAVLLAVVFVLTCMMFLTRSKEPTYQGRPLGKWLRGHPREYYPAVLALGTNALPYLLSELQATDSRASQWGQGMLAKVSIGPFWRTALDRRYHAGLGLQILDTNAVPALLNIIFSRPIGIGVSESSYAATSALQLMGSTEAHRLIAERLVVALGSPDTVECRNACLVLSFCAIRDDEIAVSLITLSRDPNAAIRGAAVRAIFDYQRNEDSLLPALTARLKDEQAGVRRLAIEALRVRHTNAIAALPALKEAYTNELTQSNTREDLRDNGFAIPGWSATEVRQAIRNAIREIDPSEPLPIDPP